MGKTSLAVLVRECCHLAYYFLLGEKRIIVSIHNSSFLMWFSIQFLEEIGTTIAKSFSSNNLKCLWQCWILLFIKSNISYSSHYIWCLMIANWLWFLISHQFEKLAYLPSYCCQTWDQYLLSPKWEHLLRDRWPVPLLSLIFYNDSILMNHYSRVLLGMQWKPLVKSLPRGVLASQKSVTATGSRADTWQIGQQAFLLC